MRSSASGGSRRGTGWVVPTPRQSHWPTTSPRSAHWPLRAQCQPTGISIWKSLHRRGECPQSRSSGPDSGGTLTVPPILLPCPGKAAPPHPLAVPTAPPGSTPLSSRAHSPTAPFVYPPGPTPRVCSPPTPHGKHQEDRPGLVCPVCGTWWPGRSMEQWPWLGL